jgi:hypothetical protein
MAAAIFAYRELKRSFEGQCVTRSLEQVELGNLGHVRPDELFEATSERELNAESHARPLLCLCVL